MSDAPSRTQPLGTHEVFNQTPPFEDVDLFTLDTPLAEAVARNGVTAASELAQFGRRWGTGAMIGHGRAANEFPPRLHIFDARGNRSDTASFHPSWHALMAESMAAGLHNSTWTSEGTQAAAPSEVMRAAKFYMAAQIETGHLCPLTMTRASVAALATEPAVLAQLMPKIAGRDYDKDFKPWRDKSAMTLGMGMTEKQGGTDVRANITRAVRNGDAYIVTGHKWFMSAPMCDAFLVLAQAEGGLTCFLLPRFRGDGEVNAIHIQRLKDKLGNRSNASSEVEFVEAEAVRVGAEGQGIRTIIQMVQLTRLDCAIASAGLMRATLAQALHHARHRSVFQKHLADQPLMQSVLADMALQVEASVALVMRLCRSFDHAKNDAAEAARMRILTPAVKYLVCKTAPAFAYEAMECLGGNGYVEESVMPRHYREAPVNAIWEGSGNVMCLDVLRAVARDTEPAALLLTQLVGETKGLPGVAVAEKSIADALASPEGERRARFAVEQLALLAATAALNASAPDLAEAFARARFEHPSNFYGAAEFPPALPERLMNRALPR